MATESAPAPPELPPADAARALAELRTRQAQLLAERRTDPRWLTAATLALSAAGIATRQLDEAWPHRRRVRTLVVVANLVAGLPWGSATRADLWLGDPAALASGDALKDEANAPVLRAMATTGSTVGSTFALGALGRLAVGRLRARGVRLLWIADVALLVVMRLLALRSTARTTAALRAAAREVEAASTDAIEAPALAPQLADPTAFSIAALLLPARAAREDLLAEALPLDRVVLADRLAALARAGLVASQRRGRLRAQPWWSLTARGRELATAHAAALRRAAA